MNRLSLLSLFMLSVLAGNALAKEEAVRSERKGKRVIRQEDIPFTIKCPGEYTLGEDINFDKVGAAITVSSNDVKLHLKTFSITTSTSGSVGILVTNPSGETVSEVTIQSDAISNSSESSIGSGILLLNTNKVLIDNVFIENYLNNLDIQNSSDVRVLNSQFLNGSSAGANVSGSTNVVFEGCVFNDNLNGINFNSASQDCSVFNCSFPNSGSTNLFAAEINGLIIENSTFSNTGDTNQSNLVQLGDTTNTAANNVIVRNSTFTNLSTTNTFPEGLDIQNGSGFLIESCVFLNNNVNQPFDSDLSGIHFGGAGASVFGVTVRNCVIQGPAIDGIYPDIGSSNGLVEHCVAAGSLKDGILANGTNNTTIQYNTAVSCGINGIALGQGSSSCAVLNNVSSGNGNDGIFIQGAIPQQFPASSENLVQFNATFSNGNFGIEDQGDNDRIFSNTAYNNTAGNYFVAANTPLNAPGDATTAGANLNA